MLATLLFAEQETVTAGEIAGRLGASAGSVSTAIKSLSGVGLIERARARRGGSTRRAPTRRHQLGYDTALAAGRPTATGAIEGACRHLVGDRLDITGAPTRAHSKLSR